MNSPYGREYLVNAIVTSSKERQDLLEGARRLKSLVIPERFLSDCEMLAVGAFSPLEGFMNEEEISSVLKNLCLTNGLVWGIPIIILVPKEQASSIKLKEKIALLDKSRRVIAIMKVTSKFKYPKDKFCKEVFRTLDLSHPGVKMIKESPDMFLSGPIKLLDRPLRNEIPPTYYLDPAQTREEFKKRKWSMIVAFQTRNPIHRAHEFLIKCALEIVDGVLIHPLVGETKPDDIPAAIRIKCYEVLIKNYFNAEKVVMSVLPTFMRYAGPRETLNHAIIRKNYGCTHFIIGRDHAGIGNYYGTYEAQELFSSYAERIGIIPVKFENAFYCKKCEAMATAKTCRHSQENHLHLSGTKFRNMLKEGIYPPLEFSRKEVVDILMEWAKDILEDPNCKTFSKFV
ncbi:MAG: sulfate adenylyltransferase [Omnitrophica WOR_2 bacterium SM23_29]|nr:MAG: sulfate adenylyltransferase [Omnitrophica WOR_2 bacterium SM23_29]